MLLFAEARYGSCPKQAHAVNKQQQLFDLEFLQSEAVYSKGSERFAPLALSTTVICAVST